LGIAVNAAGDAYVTGITNSTNFPTVGPLPGQETNKGGSGSKGQGDAFVTRLRVAADLSVVLSDAPDPARVGQPLTYTVGVQNAGPDTAQAVSVRNALPGGVEFVSAAGCSETERVVTCDLGELASGAPASREIVVRPTVADPALSNTVTVQSATFDSVSVNDSNNAVTEVKAAEPTPDLTPTPPAASDPPAASAPPAALGLPAALPGILPAPTAPLGVAQLDNKATMAARAAEARRALGLRRCLSSARRQKSARRRLAQRRCLALHGRTPGKVTAFSARARSSRQVELAFQAPGSDRTRPPAARSYVIMQSARPIRTARDLKRAQALCKANCRFGRPTLGERLTLKVTDLRPKTTYYYTIAARDNVSGRLGPRSQTVRIRTR